MATVGPPPLHPDLAPLAGLLGEWRGEGEGAYEPRVAPFRYGEMVGFAHVGKPFMSYTQRTWSLDDGRPLHSESGFLRATANGALELVLAHGPGFAEIELGRLEAGRITLRSAEVLRTPTAKPVTSLERDLSLDGDELRYEVRMGLEGSPARWHLSATLRRAEAGGALARRAGAAHR